MYLEEISFSFPTSLLLAPSAGVDAASLGPHEVLAGGEQSVVQAATEGVGVKRGRVHRGRQHELGHEGGWGEGVRINTGSGTREVKIGRWVRRRHGSWVGFSLETGEQQENSTELGGDHGDTEENT